MRNVKIVVLGSKRIALLGAAPAAVRNVLCIDKHAFDSSNSAIIAKLPLEISIYIYIYV